MTYYDDFKDWDDVKRHFEMYDLEPEHVLFAAYAYENYSGEAFVLFRNDGKLWLATGSHCSCYGLEGQWSPEETTPEVINEMIAKRWADDDILVRHRTAIMIALGIDGIGR